MYGAAMNRRIAQSLLAILLVALLAFLGIWWAGGSAVAHEVDARGRVVPCMSRFAIKVYEPRCGPGRVLTLDGECVKAPKVCAEPETIATFRLHDPCGRPR